MPMVTQDLLGQSGQPPPTLCGRGPGGGAASGARGAPSSRGASPASRGACRPREPRRPWDEGPAQWRPPPSAAVCWFPFVARVQLEGAAQARACSLFLAAPPCEQGRCAQAGPQGAASRISVRGAGFSASQPCGPESARLSRTCPGHFTRLTWPMALAGPRPATHGAGGRPSGLLAAGCWGMGPHGGRDRASHGGTDEFPRHLRPAARRQALSHVCSRCGRRARRAASAPRPLAAPASDGETVAAQSRERFRGPPTPSWPCLGASARWSPAGSRTADLTLHLHRRLSMSGVPTAPQQQGHSLCHRRGKGTWDRARMAPRTPTSGVQGIGLRLWGAGRTSGRAEPRDWPQRPARLTRWPGGAGSGPSASGSCPRPPPRFSPLAEPPRPSVLGGAEMHTRLPLWGAAQEGPRGPAPSPARSRRRWPCA